MILARRCVAAAGLVVAACASLPPPGERFEGRIAVQVAGDARRSFSAGFELAGSATRGRLVLTTPLGTGAAEADWSAERVRLRSGGGERLYPDLDSLSYDALGESVPISALFDWLRGRPWAGAGSAPTPAGFEQLGWSVDLSRRTEGWVLAQRSAPPAVTVRVKLDGAVR
ncbi:MAG TPA: outer membrane lipoprotein LolB [Methylibium sp.]|nr:outer membrane lipoprotein LolB [Methylibium sp.]